MIGRHWLPMATNNLPIDHKCTMMFLMFLTKLLPIMIGTNSKRQILYFKLVKHWQNIDNKYNALVTISNPLVEINI